jgi:hypothetical protein
MRRYPLKGCWRVGTVLLAAASATSCAMLNADAVNRQPDSVSLELDVWKSGGEPGHLDTAIQGYLSMKQIRMNASDVIVKFVVEGEGDDDGPEGSHEYRTGHFASCNTLGLGLDDKPLSMEHEQYSWSEDEETVLVHVPSSAIRQLARGRTVGGWLCDETFSLDDQQIASLKESRSPSTSERSRAAARPQRPT